MIVPQQNQVSNRTQLGPVSPDLYCLLGNGGPSFGCRSTGPQMGTLRSFVLKCGRSLILGSCSWGALQTEFGNPQLRTAMDKFALAPESISDFSRPRVQLLLLEPGQVDLSKHPKKQQTEHLLVQLIENLSASKQTQRHKTHPSIPLPLSEPACSRSQNGTVTHKKKTHVQHMNAAIRAKMAAGIHALHLKGRLEPLEGHFSE